MGRVMKANSSEIKSGVCICKFEPNGMNGLEGFTQGDKYNFKLMMHNENGKEYYRVYHRPEYYETCGKIVFKKWFKEV